MPLSHVAHDKSQPRNPARSYGELDAFESVDALDADAPDPCGSGGLEGDDGHIDMVEHFRGLLSEKESSGDFGGMAACYLSLGDAHLARGEAEKAEAMYRKSLALSRLVRTQPGWPQKGP